MMHVTIHVKCIWIYIKAIAEFSVYIFEKLTTLFCEPRFLNFVEATYEDLTVETTQFIRFLAAWRIF